MRWRERPEQAGAGATAGPRSSLPFQHWADGEEVKIIVHPLTSFFATSPFQSMAERCWMFVGNGQPEGRDSGPGPLAYLL